MRGIQAQRELVQYTQYQHHTSHNTQHTHAHAHTRTHGRLPHLVAIGDYRWRVGQAVYERTQEAPHLIWLGGVQARELVAVDPVGEGRVEGWLVYLGWRRGRGHGTRARGRRRHSEHLGLFHISPPTEARRETIRSWHTPTNLDMPF